jgi:hypothetical protein
MQACGFAPVPAGILFERPRRWGVRENHTEFLSGNAKHFLIAASFFNVHFFHTSGFGPSLIGDAAATQ